MGPLLILVTQVDNSVLPNQSDAPSCMEAEGSRVAGLLFTRVSYRSDRGASSVTRGAERSLVQHQSPAIKMGYVVSALIELMA